VTVVVPHYSDLQGLAACLACLERQTYPRDRFEIVVADNNSPQGAAAVEQVIAGRGRLTVVTEKGAGPARNGGAALARGQILAFTDSDCQPEPQWLAEGVAALDGADVVGGRVTVLVDDPDAMTPIEGFEKIFAFRNDLYVRVKKFTGSGNLFCRRETFDAVGGFRPAVSEDIDWSHRAIAAGFRLTYAERATVGHPARRTWDELARKYGRVCAEMYALSRQARHGRARWLLRSLVMPFSAIVHSPRVLTNRELRRLGDKFAVLAVLYRIRAWRATQSLRLLAEDIRRSHAPIRE
jgi:glycosyltransferase involved in cell wall biosynthesis